MKTTISSTLVAAVVLFAAVACGTHEDHAEHGGEEHGHAGEGRAADGGHPDEVTIDEKTAVELGIRTAPVAAGAVRDAHEVQGLLTPIEGKHARVRARFPGPVHAVRVGVGDVVKAGQTLAIVESNVSLSNYSVTAPFAGTVLAVNAGPGDQAGEEPLFEIADLSSLWVDIHLFGRDAQHITPGLPVEVTRVSDGAHATTKLDRVLPGTATASQSTVARATIANADGQWRPGAAVRARVTVSERQATLVVPTSALQTFEGKMVAFVKRGDKYEPRELRLGERDSRHAEVLAGLVAGDEVVTEQSYLIKADLEKESASHEH
jgi:cobalt-zinc-cadmium efflux system membrane fusion protein